jgi:predicted O-linked N-acetylglucosamine transferase (SPINDLY family)
MGVPVVTLAGNRPVSRQSLCVLGNLGLEELASDKVEGFVERAIALARDPARIGQLRGTLRQRMQASPLMDAPRFAQAFVNVLRDAAGGVV